MWKSKLKARLLGGVLLILSFVCNTAFAQISWLRPEPEKAVTLQVLKARFVDGGDIAFSTSLWFLSANIPLSLKTQFVVELPFSHFDLDEQPFLDYGYNGSSRYKAQNLIGNPYLGLQFRSLGSSTIGSIGVRLPMAQEDKLSATIAGTLGAYDRAEAFIPDLLTLAASLGFCQVSSDNLTLKGLLGPTMLINTKSDRHDDKTQMYLDFHGELRVKANRIWLAGGLTGRYLLVAEDASDLDFGERITNQLGVAITYDGTRLLPGFYLQVPLDSDLQDVVDYTYGLNLTLKLD